MPLVMWRKRCIYFNVCKWKCEFGALFSITMTTVRGSVLVHLSRRNKCTIEITCCLSSIRPSFSHFRIFLLFVSTSDERNSTKLYKKQDLNVLYKACLIIIISNDFRTSWLSQTVTFSTSHLKPWNEIQQILTGGKVLTSSTTFVFVKMIGKKMASRLLIGWNIFHFSSDTAERNSMTLARKQGLNVIYQVCDFWPIGRTRWPSQPQIGWEIFHFSSETLYGIQRNLTKSKI